MTDQEFDQLFDNGESILETLEVMLFDLLTSQYGNYTQEFIVREIEELYGEEVATDLIESATDASQG
jgi:hypothetical protein